MAETQGAAENPSRTRDHLANERTYLAWLRTAANVMVVGLAIAKFASSSGASAVAAGGVLIVVGAVGLGYGTIRYRKVNREIESNDYITGSRGRAPVVASTVLVIAMLMALVLLTLGR